MQVTEVADFADPDLAPRPVSMLRAQLAHAASTGWHSHSRAQLLYCARGCVAVDFEQAAYVVAEGHALVIAAETSHKTSCSGPVSFCAAYIDGTWLPCENARMLQVSGLLGTLLQALAEEPMLYDFEGRGGCLARLIADELRRAPTTPFPLPMPTDKRLRRLCQTLIDAPSLNLNIDSWALQVGVSRRTLTRRFRAETNLSFGEWRRRLRALCALTQRADGVPDRGAAEVAGYRSAAALRTMIDRVGNPTQTHPAKDRRPGPSS